MPTDAFNTMSQRIALELATEHKVQVFVGATSEGMAEGSAAAAKLYSVH